MGEAMSQNDLFGPMSTPAQLFEKAVTGRDMQVRDYQLRSVSSIIEHFEAGRLRVCQAAPPGAGKTFMASIVARWAAERNLKTVFLVDRIFLVHQTWKVFADLGLEPALEQGATSRPGTGPLVTTPQTQAARGWRDLDDAGLVIWDECHDRHQAFRKYLDSADDLQALVYMLGLTATPMRPGMAAEFDALETAVTSEALEAHEPQVLVPPQYWSPRKQVIDESLLRQKKGFDDDYTGQSIQDATALYVTNAVDEYIRISNIVLRDDEDAPGPPLRSIWFTATIAQGEEYRAELAGRGIAAIQFHAGERTKDRVAPDVARAMLASGEVHALISCNVLGKGADFPEADAIVDVRPRTKTAGRASYIQGVTRGGRASPGKVEYHVLDFAGNHGRHAPYFAFYRRFGVSKLLAKREKAADEGIESGEDPCPDCGCIVAHDTSVCPACGCDLPRPCGACGATLPHGTTSCAQCAHAARVAAQTEAAAEEAARVAVNLERMGLPVPEDAFNGNGNLKRLLPEGPGVPILKNRVEEPPNLRLLNLPRTASRTVSGYVIGTVADDWGDKLVLYDDASDTGYKVVMHANLKAQLIKHQPGARLSITVAKKKGPVIGRGGRPWVKDGETIMEFKYDVQAQPA